MAVKGKIMSSICAVNLLLKVVMLKQEICLSRMGNVEVHW